MEFGDYIMKFPPYWRGVFAFLSKDHQPTVGADSWLVENREGALTCRTSRYCPRGHHVDWSRFVEGLCEKEPTQVAGQLAFLPRILLLPVNVQRNTVAFLSHHLSEIPVPCLEKLLDSLRNCSVSDEWTKHHLRTLQDFICRNRCLNYGSGLSADDSQMKLTRGSRDAFENVCRQIRDKDGILDEGGGFTLQFDWLPEAVSSNRHTCQHSRCFSSEKLNSDEAEKVVPASQEESLKKDSAIPNEGRSTSPEVIEIEESPLPSPMEVEVAAAPNLPERRSEVSVVNEIASGDFGGQSSQVKGEVVGGQRADVEDIGRKQERSRNDVVDAVTMDKLASLKAALCNSSGPVPSELARVIIGIPIDKMEAVCDILELDSTPAAGLAALAQELSGFSLELGHSSATILARRCFGQQIRDLTQTAPRTLIAAAIGFAKAFPKPLIEGAFLLALAGDGQVGGSTSHQCDLVVKVLKEALTNESRVYLLSKLLSIQTLQWSDDLTGLFQTALACKLELDNHTLEMFVTALEHHGSSRSSCAKFAKLLLAVINRFSKQISAAGLAALQRLADANQTFLKKALLGAIKRVKG
ncbi:Fanconi anemia group E protein-like [Patiria miniata]|uniref:Fanconi Anaemia group E protein C-terminal domain-containing protein n=1 Tax=Patiria miniata TaxID=46514 RepID=A0A913ZP30_PATMI|nr:Fanconi anemia group E protein-like [Patiria miniata]XP_038052878.1 Fanconi anemia group E protein-like [Patiria miniata]